MAAAAVAAEEVEEAEEAEEAEDGKEKDKEDDEDKDEENEEEEEEDQEEDQEEEDDEDEEDEDEDQDEEDEQDEEDNLTRIAYCTPHYTTPTHQCTSGPTSPARSTSAARLSWNSSSPASSLFAAASRLRRQSHSSPSSRPRKLSAEPLNRFSICFEIVLVFCSSLLVSQQPGSILFPSCSPLVGMFSLPQSSLGWSWGKRVAGPPPKASGV